MDRTEQLIVERLKENDEKAWHYLFDRHYPVLCHIASRYVHDDFLAETIVGDVILHLQHWVSTKCPFGRARPLWPSAPKMGNWLPCNGGRPQGPRPARGSECTSDSQGQHWVSTKMAICRARPLWPSPPRM